MDGSNTDPTLGWVWNEENQAYYRQEWNGEEWSTYWKRPDEMARRDSLADSVPSVEAIQGLGDTIRGDPSSGEVEPLDSSYTMQYQPRRFFRPGRMFSILYTEPLGGTAPNVNADNVSTVMFGEQVYSQIRRFIVVKEGKGFCYAW
ncbi:hypothetical protein GTA08_BOTSDO12133 [Botryosphaeria dothidea]|uniref:DUF6590 domain-containing protein n=1 Tax=Botryosphaeria dothidea TaxID=55169 RepID=A0A8H4J2V2_9PEZI|nr:hypothetical protein GTA08_BOTSDO12133 [Botryosphaeria dothidea]